MEKANLAIDQRSLSEISVYAVFLLCTVGIMMLGDRPVLIGVGPVSLLGALTGVIAAGGVLLLALTPTIGRGEWIVVWPLIGFWVYDAVATLWSPLILSSVQDTVVWGGFLFLILLSAREVRRRPEIIRSVFRVFDIATYGLLAYCFYLVATGVTKAAAIPLLLLLLSCYHLVNWRSGRTWGFGVATAFFLTNVLVNARTPAGIGFGLYFLIELMLGERRQWFRVAGLFVLLGAVLIAIWFTYPPLRKAFLTGDAGFNLGGIAINTAGRVYMWELTLESFLKAPWFGTGIDAPTEILEARGKNHPHNDYLRILHHLGSVGLFLWLLFYSRTLSWIWAVWKEVRNSLDTSVYARLYGTTFMGMTAVALSMLTDNTIVYSFVMYPLAVLIGLSVGSLVDRQHLTALHNP